MNNLLMTETNQNIQHVENIKKLSYVAPIIVNTNTNEILEGHHRHLAGCKDIRKVTSNNWKSMPQYETWQKAALIHSIEGDWSAVLYELKDIKRGDEASLREVLRDVACYNKNNDWIYYNKDEIKNIQN